MASKHLVLPDVQLRPGDNTDFLYSIGAYLVDKQPDVVVCLGDFADMASLSSYDKGKKSFEGRRYLADIQAAQEGMQRLLDPLTEYNNKQKRNGKKQYKPRMVLTLGNHEERIIRAVNNDAMLEGVLNVEALEYASFGWEVVPFLDVIVIDGIAYCLEENHKVLSKDLRYIRLGDVEVGQELLAFDEANQGNGRKYVTGKVTKKTVTPKIIDQVVLSNKKEFQVTADHRWLVRSRSGMEWKHTHELVVGDRIPKYFNEFDQVFDYDLGWLSGIFDGEGWLSKPNCKQGGIQLGVSQNDGVVLDRIKTILSKLNVPYSEHVYRKCHQIKIGGNSATKLEFLAWLRPQRLIDKFYPEMLGRMQSLGDVEIVEINRNFGTRNIVQLETTTKTLIVDGYAHHNCHYFVSGTLGRPCTSATAQLAKKHQSCVAGHQQGLQIATGHRADGRRLTSIIAGSCFEHDEDYLGPQGNKCWRGVLMLHGVDDGEFDICQVPLKYLRNKYL